MKKIRIKDSEGIIDEGCKFQPRCPYVMDKCKVEPDLKSIDESHSFACYVKLD